MKLLYCKCCDRHISRPQWNTHRTSDKCIKNHYDKCKDEHRKFNNGVGECVGCNFLSNTLNENKVCLQCLNIK